jgi:hypothetical protein
MKIIYDAQVVIKYDMKKLTVADVVDSAGGIKKLKEIGVSSGNKYFINAIDTITEQLGWANHLRLYEMETIDILDIGTGGGFFPYICELYGHRAQSCDERFSLPWENGYKHLNVDPIDYLVKKNQSVENTFNQKFDLIVSFRSFVGTTRQWIPKDDIDIWEVNDWQFFLKDCSNFLLKNNSSRIFFSCNRADELPPYNLMPKEEITIWGSKELGNFFKPYQIDRGQYPDTFGNMFTITKEQIDKEL